MEKKLKIDLFEKYSVFTSMYGDMLRSILSDDFFDTPFAFSSLIFPGFADVHVHLREPGFSYKETVRTGTLAAARGGFTDVCTMPNVNPVPDSVENLKPQLDIIERDAAVRVHPYGAITRGERGVELSDIHSLSPLVCAFSDDGHSVMDDALMREAMIAARGEGKIIASHCEDERFLVGVELFIHDGQYARERGVRGVLSECEWRQLERDIALVRETGCAYHACHISTKESVALIRQAKAEGLNITCETAPHYLLLDDSMLRDDGAFRMNPPIRSRADREALICGIIDGTIDMIATDHAPHSPDEKSRGLVGSLNGISGLECTFPVLYTGLVSKGVITLDKLIALMSENLRRRFGLPTRRDDFTLFCFGDGFAVDPCEFISMGKSTPFAGMRVDCRCLLTICGGKVAWIAPEIEKYLLGKA
ncbi:MAG: dihydroorotase [Eubacteriales bacterium]|jgi:dihydroorotase